MSSWQLGFDLIITFLLAAVLLFHYGNWYKQSIFVTLSVLVAWYFSFIIIFVLPIDISTTTYHQCLHLAVTKNTTNSTCLPAPSSYVGTEPLFSLWRVVYWSSQVLTWLLLPLTQSYTLSGEFTLKTKLKSALLDNAIYYSIYLFICVILLVYLATRPDLKLDFQQLKAIASSASNSWGLFLLVFMLGHGLVEVPRSLWFRSCKGYSLSRAYFRVSKLSEERNSAEEALDDCLETLELLKRSNLFKNELEQIELLIPTEFRERVQRRRSRIDGEVTADMKSIVKLHKNLKKSLQNHHRVEAQWEDQIGYCCLLEDVEKNARSGRRTFTSEADGGFLRKFPVFEFYIRCILYPYFLKLTSILAATLSLLVIWSEATFFNPYPVLSVFAAVIQSTSDYFLIEIVSTLTIAYMAVCAFYTVFKIRVFNFYYLAWGHNTDEYSLVFSGMLLSRLTPPLCLNVISLLHLDSHVLKIQEEETSYTKIMGHMDVLSLISDGFNIYFPMGILIISLLTWFKVGSRILGVIGFDQFLEEENEVGNDFVSEGASLVGREKRRRNNASQQISRRQQNAPTTSLQPDQQNYGIHHHHHSPPPRDLFSDV